MTLIWGWLKRVSDGDDIPDMMMMAMMLTKRWVSVSTNVFPVSSEPAPAGCWCYSRSWSPSRRLSMIKVSLLFSHSSLSFGETILQHGCFIHFFSKCIFKTSSLIDQNHVYLIIIPGWTLLFHRAAMEKCNQYIKCWSLSSLLSKCNSVTTSTLSGRHQLERKLVERHDSLKV